MSTEQIKLFLACFTWVDIIYTCKASFENDIKSEKCHSKAVLIDRIFMITTTLFFIKSIPCLRSSCIT